MATFGVDDTGFTLKRLADILADFRTALATVQDPVTGEMLTPDLADENDPLVLTVNAAADALAVCWEQLQTAYNQFDPLKATGAGLAGLVQLNAITKRPGIPSIVTLTMSGTPNLSVPSGKQVAKYDNSFVFDLPDWTFDGTGAASVVGTCIVDGPNEFVAGTVTKILTPVSGWDSCTNAADATPGALPETDAELRSRQRGSTETTAVGPIDALYGNLANLAGVTFVRVYQNIDEAITDARGIPPKQIAVVILGGDDTAIAELIHAQAPMVKTYGNPATIVNIVDLQGEQYGIQFTRPAQVPVYVKIGITRLNLNLWPSDGATRIKNAVLAYALSGPAGVGIVTGFDPQGYLPGVSPYASELYTAVNSIPGAQVTSLTIGLAPNPSGQSATILWNELATFDAANIDVTVA